MLVMKYVTFENKDTSDIKTIVVPTHISNKTIATISPMFASSGVLFKNVSIIEDSYGNYHRVVGNYKDHIKTLDDKPNKIGFK